MVKVRLTAKHVEVLVSEFKEDLCINEDGTSQEILDALDSVSKSSDYRYVTLRPDLLERCAVMTKMLLENVDEGLLGRDRQASALRKCLKTGLASLEEAK